MPVLYFRNRLKPIFLTAVDSALSDSSLSRTQQKIVYFPMHGRAKEGLQHLKIILWEKDFLKHVFFMEFPGFLDKE